MAPNSYGVRMGAACWEPAFHEGDTVPPGPRGTPGLTRHGAGLGCHARSHANSRLGSFYNSHILAVSEVSPKRKRVKDITGHSHKGMQQGVCFSCTDADSSREECCVRRYRAEWGVWHSALRVKGAGRVYVCCICIITFQQHSRPCTKSGDQWDEGETSHIPTRTF